MLIQVLEQQGFSQIESRVLLACLELGQAPASSVARKLRENRVTIYSVLQNLHKKGFVVVSVRDKVSYYSAISPDDLVQKAEDKTSLLREKLPELMALANTFDNKPVVQFYEGLDGLKVLYDDILKYPDATLKSFLGYGKVEPTLEKYLNQVHVPGRVKKNIWAQVILSDPEGSANDYLSVVREKTTIKLIQDEYFSMSNEIQMYGENKVAIIMYQKTEMMGFILQSKTLFTTLSALFDLVWRTH